MPGRPENHTAYDPLDVEIIAPFIQRTFREDAAGDLVGENSIFIARMLDYVKTTTYELQLPSINADRLVPDDTSIPEWAETVTQTTYDAVGMAKIIANYADDLPRADVRGAQRLFRVRTLGDSFGYNVNEIRASRATGVGLDARKAAAARRAVDLKIALIKLKGDLDYGLYGLFNHPNLPAFVFPVAGAWSGLTGDQLYQNLVAMANGYYNQNLGVHTANALCLAPVAYQAVSSKFMTATVGGYPVTPLSVFQANYPGVTVENVFECAGASASGKDIALMYERNAANISHGLVMPFTQLPPEARNLEIITNCLARSAGVQIFYPLALLAGPTS